MSSQDDPRDPSLESKVTLPKTWFRESNDVLSSAGMFLSGLIVVTRNRYLAWPAILFAINSFINSHPLRTKDGGSNVWSVVGLAVASLISSYIPFVLSAARA